MLISFERYQPVIGCFNKLVKTFLFCIRCCFFVYPDNLHGFISIREQGWQVTRMNQDSTQIGQICVCTCSLHMLDRYARNIQIDMRYLAFAMKNHWWNGFSKICLPLFPEIVFALLIIGRWTTVKWPYHYKSIQWVAVLSHTLKSQIVYVWFPLNALVLFYSSHIE